VIDLSEAECNVLRIALEDVPTRSAFSPFSALSTALRADADHHIEQLPR
jgi:hypothetical protein